MGYDRDKSLPFDFEPNGILFGSKSLGKLSPRSYTIHSKRKWKYSFVSVGEKYTLRNWMHNAYHRGCPGDYKNTYDRRFSGW